MLSLVITCYNRLPQLQKAMPSINLEDCDELVFTDGGSTDGTVEWIQENYPQAILVQVPESPPHRDPKTNNMGIAVASGDIIILQGAEIQHESPAMQLTLRHFEKKPRGIVVTPHTVTLEQFGTPNITQSNSYRYAFIAMNRQDFITMGGFNEHYTQWGNWDHEFDIRCRAMGYEMIEDPEIRVRHLAHQGDPGNHKRWREECWYQTNLAISIELGETSPVLPWGYGECSQ